MEVHTHSHSPKKKWTHYLWEFLMLFLAVTIGFYADNIRETKMHNHEAYINMRSLLSDLRGDVNLFDSVIDRNNYSIDMADSLVELLHGDLSRPADIYFAARAVTANIGYFYTNPTSFEQMKSAGLLRLVHPRKLLDSIGNYYGSFQWLQNQTELLRLKSDQMHKGNADLFDSYVFHKMMDMKARTFGHSNHVIINRPEGDPPLLTKDHVVLNSISMNYHYYQTTARYYVAQANRLRALAMRLIGWIEEEYGFE